MKDVSAAFYLIGHGPRREPRLVELQHMRILRYRSVAAHPDETFSRTPQVFIDLNHERRDPTPHLQHNFPQFHALLSAIADRKIGIVYLDIREEQSPTVDYSWVSMYLKGAGAEIVNVFYDEDRVFEKALKLRYGPDALVDDIDDASDFLCFFPRSAFRITSRSLAGSPSGLASIGQEEMLSRWGQLKDLNPYATGNVPFAEARLERIWEDLWYIRRKREQAERRKTEHLYRIAPDDQGLLIDEGYHSNEARTSESLIWAEKRVCEDLQFTKIVEDRFISYCRTVEEWNVFADIRSEGRINFYVFGKTHAPRGSSQPSFSILDRIKSDLKKRWLDGLNGFRS